jgi:hypothetical protein
MVVNMAAMFLRPHFRRRNGKREAYWALVESYRTERGPRQRTVAYLGLMDEAGRLGIEQAADPPHASAQQQLFAETNVEPRFVEIDRTRVRVENCRQFGGPWLALELVKRLGLDDFLRNAMPPGRERVPWSLTALVLVIARLCEPSSELHIAEHFYRNTALCDLLGVPIESVDDNRLYRGLDALLPHKPALEAFLKRRFGELFAVEYDLLLYDVTSTYFEGQADANPLAKRGYSRDHRPDCKQVCIGLVVTRCGLPLGYEVFAGNRCDSTTLQEIVATMEARYGAAQRIWALDRGMVSEANIEFLKAGERRYIVGTPKSQLKRFERQLLAPQWRTVRDGLEVQLCACPDGGEETFVPCRSRDRQVKEQAMHARFERRIDEGLAKIAAACARSPQQPGAIERRVGSLLGQNTRAAKLFDIRIRADERGAAQIEWAKVEGWRSWSQLSQGAYVLRTNVRDWSDEELWRAYTQLADAEAAFRIQKTDLKLRPVWHQKQDRVLAHILVCFLAYVLWKLLGQLCQRAGLGDEPRRVLDELAELRAVDVVVPAKAGPELRTRCITQPSEHQKILLEHLNLKLPTYLHQTHL